ncbi:polysaccharide deacetylase family protein, partial [Candidatus Saccharibacteria bacterium]|nr:polysaccharide deacetylase family protein [Candidatus Saccharibacteria bacterium]
MGRKRDLVSKTASRVARPISVAMPKRKEKYQKAPKLAVVMFHRIALEPSSDVASRDLVMSVETFRKYLELFRSRFRICTLHEAEKLLGRDLEKPLMVLTFDDGYEDFYLNAFPILREMELPVNQNIIARYADERTPGYLNWDEILELRSSGLVEFGSHTYDLHHHKEGRALVEGASREEILTDLERAQESFSSHIGFKPDILAWPYGVAPHNVSREDMARLGIRFELNTVSGMNFGPVDFSRLKRFVALDYETPEKLLSIIEGYS